jgi:hypothetical protein
LAKDGKNHCESIGGVNLALRSGEEGNLSHVCTARVNGTQRASILKNAVLKAAAQQINPTAH